MGCDEPGIAAEVLRGCGGAKRLCRDVGAQRRRRRRAHEGRHQSLGGGGYLDATRVDLSREQSQPGAVRAQRLPRSRPARKNRQAGRAVARHDFGGATEQGGRYWLKGSVQILNRYLVGEATSSCPEY